MRPGTSQRVAEEMDLLKDDRFLSGANWSEVRKYLPDPVAYPLTSEELAEMDTLAEIRRRLLERKEVVQGNSDPDC